MIYRWGKIIVGGGLKVAKEVVIPTNEPIEETAKVEEAVVEETVEQVEEKEEPITAEEAEYIKKVFFEDDEMVTLRDGKTYRIPPLSLRDGLKLMEKLNGIDTSVIVLNLMAFKPYYPEMTTDYIADYVDLASAKEILDIMIGLNQIKKNM